MSSLSHALHFVDCYENNAQRKAGRVREGTRERETERKCRERAEEGSKRAAQTVGEKTIVCSHKMQNVIQSKSD